MAGSGNSDASCRTVQCNSRDLDNQTFSKETAHYKNTSQKECDKTDEPSLDELNSIVNEMRQYKKEKKSRSLIKDKSYGKSERNSSGVSRDSGIMSSETIPSDEDRSKEKQSDNARVTSATSRSSALSDFSLDDDETMDSCTDRTDSRTSADPASIRQISAYKNRKKTIHQTAHLDNLLSTAKSVSFNVPSGTEF